MVSPLRRIGKSANQRIGNSRGLVCPRNHISLQRVRNASQPARRFSRINEPRANYPPPWKLSWKYWKVRGVEWLLLVSGTTILLHDGCWATATISNSKYKWKKKKRKKGKKRNTRPKRGIRVNEKEWKLRAWEWNKRSSIVGFVRLPGINHVVREILMGRWTILSERFVHISVQSYFLFEGISIYKMSDLGKCGAIRR